MRERCYTTVQHNKVFFLGFLAYARNDIWVAVLKVSVILNGTKCNEESLPIERERFLVGLTPSLGMTFDSHTEQSKYLRLVTFYHSTRKCQFHVGEGVPAFIGLPGAREKTERGRGLFERSEFRSTRRRPMRKAGIPDNRRATFLGYFFAAGKKLQTNVILNEA